MTSEELIIEIGTILLRSARRQYGRDWSYSGYVFETVDGDSSGGEKYIYRDTERLEHKFTNEEFDALLAAFKALRISTLVPGDVHWVACKVVAREDGDVQILFEFDDIKRWKIKPQNLDQSFAILVGDVYPQ